MEGAPLPSTYGVLIGLVRSELTEILLEAFHAVFPALAQAARSGPIELGI